MEWRDMAGFTEALLGGLFSGPVRCGVGWALLAGVGSGHVWSGVLRSAKAMRTLARLGKVRAERPVRQSVAWNSMQCRDMAGFALLCFGPLSYACAGTGLVRYGRESAGLAVSGTARNGVVRQALPRRVTVR